MKSESFTAGLHQQSPVSFPHTSPDWRSVLLLVMAVLLYVAWSFVRSAALNELSDYDYGGLGHVAQEIAIPFLAFFFILALVSARRIESGLWFLGCVSTLAMTPQIRGLPFVREYGHLVIWALVFYLAWDALHGRLRDRITLPRLGQLDPVFALLVLFFAEGVASAAFGYARTEWFTGLKINVSELLVHLSILLFMGMVLYGKAGARVAYPALFDGLRLGIMVAIGLGFFGIASIFIKGFSHGTDTALGFAYFDRLKSTFNSPDSAGLFYAASIPVLAWVAADAPAGSWRRRTPWWAWRACRSLDCGDRLPHRPPGVPGSPWPPASPICPCGGCLSRPSHFSPGLLLRFLSPLAPGRAGRAWITDRWRRRVS